MARKRHKKKSPIFHYQRMSTDALHERLGQARERGDARAGIDMAKECYRRDPSPAHARLLCEQYHRRARQLMEKNLCTEAMTVLGHALLLGPGNPDLLRLAFDCGLRSGDYETAMQVFGRLKDEAEKSRARVLLADQAVAKGEVVSRHGDPTLREDASRIRRAFAAFERGDDPAVSAELQAIGLRSPCASWKWLLLGLAAYARREADVARRCWSRADGEGAAARLARSLATGDQAPSGRDASASAPLPLRPDGGFDNPRLAKLRQIKAALDRGEKEEALKLCSALIATIEPSQRQAYALRLGRAVCKAIDVEPESGDRLRRLFGPLPEDPWYTRAAAIHLEDTDAEEALYGWNLYLQGMRANPAIPAHLRQRARALIWRRMGELAERLEPPEALSMIEPFVSGHGATYDAIEYYEKSISCFPDCQQTQGMLLDALRRRGYMRAAEDQAEQILERWPTHVSSLLFVADCCVARNAFRKALSYLARAREAEPFNGKIRREMHTCLLFSARRRLNKRNIRLARKDYEAAETLCEPGDDAFPLYCKWAALEWRAGNAEHAEELFRRAQISGTDPLLLYYQLAIEVSRAQAPKEVRNRFETLLAEHWRGEPTAANAAAVAELAIKHDETGVVYDGCDAHRRVTSDYLQRAHALGDFTEAQLMVVCRYLSATDDHRLAARYAEKGAGQFPENYHFPLLTAEAEFRQGRRKLRRKTQKLLRRAQEQAARAGDFSAAARIETLEYRASIGFGSKRAPAGLLEMLGELVSCEEDEGFPLPPPAWRRSKRKPRRRRESAEPLLFPDWEDAEEEG